MKNQRRQPQQQQQKPKTTKATATTTTCILFMRIKCNHTNRRNFHSVGKHSYIHQPQCIHSYTRRMQKYHKQDVFCCTLLYLKRINVLQRLVVNFDEVGRFLFDWHSKANTETDRQTHREAEKRESWLTYSAMLYLPCGFRLVVSYFWILMRFSARLCKCAYSETKTSKTPKLYRWNWERKKSKEQKNLRRL